MFADLFNGFIHVSNFALNYKEEKHFVKPFAYESKHFSIVEIISWILFLNADMDLCNIWAIILELYNSHVF